MYRHFITHGTFHKGRHHCRIVGKIPGRAERLVNPDFAGAGRHGTPAEGGGDEVDSRLRLGPGRGELHPHERVEARHTRAAPVGKKGPGAQAGRPPLLQRKETPRSSRDAIEQRRESGGGGRNLAAETPFIRGYPRRAPVRPIRRTG